MSIPCLASTGAPPDTRKVLSTIFGSSTPNQGLSLFSESLDWKLISSCAVTLPFTTQINFWIGTIASLAILPAIYYSNAFNARHLPFISSSMFLSNGTVFNPTMISDGQGSIDENKLDEIGLPSLTATHIRGTVGSNMAVTAMPLHVVLFMGKYIVKSLKNARNKTIIDPQYQAMKKYKEVP